MTMAAPSAIAPPRPSLTAESLYVGVDIGKRQHVAGFVSATLLTRHERFEGCPALAFEQSREGFRRLVDRIRTYVPLEQCFVLLEQTGHYHRALEQYLLELDVAVFRIHVQRRPAGLVKTDKRDALGLAIQLYNQLEKGVQVSDPAQHVRRTLPPTEAATLLAALVRHRYELSQERIQRMNKLTALCDELFPEFTHVCRDPSLPSALALRERFPTPHALATASPADLRAARVSRHPSDRQLERLRELARDSIGTKDPGRQRGLVFEQAQLIRELRLLEEHLRQLEDEITGIVARSREGQILLSVPGIGSLHAAALIACIGNVANFPSAAALKSYCGWAPRIAQSGRTVNRTGLTPGGRRLLKQTLYLIVWRAIRLECEWAHIYAELVPRKCAYDERTRAYKGKGKVIGRIAGQVVSLIYALLKADQERVRALPPGVQPPPPLGYDPAIHHAHRHGHYRSNRPAAPPATVLQLPRAADGGG
jgi:transposase